MKAVASQANDHKEIEYSNQTSEYLQSGILLYSYQEHLFGVLSFVSKMESQPSLLMVVLIRTMKNREYYALGEILLREESEIAKTHGRAQS